MALAIELPAEYGGRFIDLTDCPASIVESAPCKGHNQSYRDFHSRAGRIPQLQRHGLRQEPSPAARQRPNSGLRHGISAMRFVAIQASAAEGYRTWNGMSEVARNMAESMPVVVFDDKPWNRSGTAARERRASIGLDLLLGFALACEARLIIAPDSALLHPTGDSMCRRFWSD